MQSPLKAIEQGALPWRATYAHEFEQHQYSPVERDRAGAAPVVRAILTLDGIEDVRRPEEPERLRRYQLQRPLLTPR